MVSRKRPRRPTTTTTNLNHNSCTEFKLNTNENLSKCDEKDVISFNPEILISLNKLKQIIHESFSTYAINEVIASISNHSDLENSSAWFYEGEVCEILCAGSPGWQKGKMKINVTLEFIPDEPEEKSPLDDVRQEIEQDNS